MKQTILMTVEGLQGPTGALAVQKALFNLDGVSKATVSAYAHRATITFEDSAVSVAKIQKAVRNLGYQTGEPVKGRRFSTADSHITFRVPALTKSGDPAKLCRSLRKLPGVERVETDMAAKQIKVSFDSAKADEALIARSIAQMGYRAEGESTSGQGGRLKKKAGLLWSSLCLGVTAAFSLLVFYLALAGILPLPLPAAVSPEAAPLAFALLQLVLFLPILIAGAGILIKGLLGVVTFRPKKESPAAIGVFASLALSVYGTFQIASGDVQNAVPLFYSLAALIFVFAQWTHLLDKKSQRLFLSSTGSSRTGASPHEEDIRSARTQRAAEMITPLLVLCALLTAVVWWAAGDSIGLLALRFALLLAAACPCGFALASAAIYYAAKNAAGASVFFRDEAAMEAAADIHNILFSGEKMFYRGIPRVVDILASKEVSAQEVLAVAAAAGYRSNLNFCKIVRSFARKNDISFPQPEHTEDLSPHASAATVNGITALIGSRQELMARGVRFPAQVPPPPEGCTSVYVALERRLIGILLLREPRREEAEEALSLLQKQEILIKTSPGTGSGEQKSPQTESSPPASLQTGRKAFVTDRVPAENAPSEAVTILFSPSFLKDAGIADILIGQDDLLSLPSVIRLSRKFRRITRQNLVLCAAASAAGILMASGVLWPWNAPFLPLAAAGIGLLFSLAIWFNSLRLRG